MLTAVQHLLRVACEINTVDTRHGVNFFKALQEEAFKQGKNELKDEVGVVAQRLWTSAKEADWDKVKMPSNTLYVHVFGCAALVVNLSLNVIQNADLAAQARDYQLGAARRSPEDEPTSGQPLASPVLSPAVVIA